MKDALRKRMKSGRESRKASEQIQQRLMAQDWWDCAFQTGVYLATPREPSTDLLLADLQARGSGMAVPVRHRQEYEWGWVDANTRWVEGAHGIREPATAPAASGCDLRVIVVPGVAFDAKGGRLGHGRGHFDRMLAESKGLLVGLCFESQLVEEVPMEAHDIPMDVVITEKRICFTETAEGKLSQLTG